MIPDQVAQSQIVQEVMLPVQQLQPNPMNRKTFDTQGLQELSGSIKVKGIIDPIVVRKLADDKYQIASGERRWRAAMQAGLTEVPCRVLELSDDEVQDMNLVTNIQREDIPALEKASMVKTLMDSKGLTKIQAASRLGKSPSWIGDILQVLGLPKKVQDDLAIYKLGVKPMRAIASLPNEDYQAQIAKELQDEKIKPENVEHRAHQLHNGFKASMAKRNKKATTAVVAAPVVTPAAVIPPASPAEPAKTSAPKTQSAPVAAEPNVTASILTALKDDVADAYLPSFGKAGGALRQGLDKAWVAPKKGLVKWGLVFVVVSWLWHPVLKTINYAFTRLNKNTVGSVRSVVEPQKFTEAMLATVQAPTGLKPEMLSGKRIHFTWNPVPGCAGYNFYSAHASATSYYKENPKPVTATGATWSSESGLDNFRFVVTAVDDHDHESVYSEPVEVDIR